MPLGLPFHSHQVISLRFLTSGLCWSAGLWRRILIGWAQSSPITARLWLQRRELLVEVPCGVRLCFTPHMVLNGCQPSAGSVIAALKDNALSSFLVLPAVLWALLMLWHGVPATARLFSPHLLAVSCGALLLRKKRSLVKREEGKVVHVWCWKEAQHLSGNCTGLPSVYRSVH